MKELNYYPDTSARALRSHQIGTFAFLLLDEAAKYLADPLTNLIMAGIGDVLRERGLSLLIHTVRPGKAKKNLFEPLLRRSVDGALVLISGEPANRRWYLDQLAQMEQPVVVFDEVLNDTALLSVRAADRDAGRMVTEHLISKGHRRIAFIATRVPTAIIEQRYLGYADALRSAGIDPDAELTVSDADWQPAGGAAMAKQLMGRPEPPTAIICAHDVLAIGALHAVQALDIAVPDQVAIAGFDDYAISAWLRPTLTSVQLPAYEMGRIGATMLLEARNGIKPNAGQIVLPVKLISRGST